VLSTAVIVTMLANGVIAFYFSASKGSQLKDQTIAAMATGTGTGSGK
jgi:hypothetical protein